MALALYLGAILVTALVLYLIIVKRHFDAGSFYIAGTLLLLVPGAVMVSTGLQAQDSNPFLSHIDLSSALLTQATIFIVYGLGFLGGYMLFARTALPRVIFPYFNERRSDAMTFAGLIAITLINAAIIAGPLLKGGGFLNAVYLIRNEFYFSGANYLRIFLAIGTFLCAAHFAHILRHLRGGSYGFSSISLAGGLFLANLFLSSFLGGKGFIVYPLIFFFLALFARNLYRRLGVVLMLFMAFVALVVALQQVRVEMVHDNQTLSAWDYAYVGLRMRLFEDNLVYLGTHGDLHETKMGEDFINGIVGPVPRSLWPDKPKEITAGARFKRQLMPQSNGGWPPYGFNQWYMNFGWLGVLAGGLITGLLLQALQRVYADYQTNTYSFVIMMVFLVRLLLNGGVTNMFFIEYVFYILPLFVFAKLTDKRLYATPDINLRSSV